MRRIASGRRRRRAGRFEDAARVLEDVFDRGADGVGVDDDEIVDEFTRQAERLFADKLYGSAVGEEADVVELDTLAGGDERTIASESTICTPMTLISGRTALM